MATSTRRLTAGNESVNYANLRQNLTTINPVVANTMRNAVSRNGRNPETDELNGDRVVNPSKLTRLSNLISNNINATTDLRVITPYIDKADLIWRTIMLYPNGKQERIIKRDTQSSSTKNAKLHAEILARWDNYYTNDYKIEKDLKKIISDILINTGSYALFNLSRPGLDYLINGSELLNTSVEGSESLISRANSFFNDEFQKEGSKVLARNKGKFIRDPDVSRVTVGGLESLFSSGPAYNGTEVKLFGKEDPEGVTGITITDNPNILFLQKFGEVKRSSDVASVTGVESLNLMIKGVLEKKVSPPLDDGSHYLAPEGKQAKGRKPEGPQATTLNLTQHQLDQTTARLFPNRNPETQTVQFIKTHDALSIAPYGRGLVWHIPSEAIIPVHLNGSNGTQTDFIILTDPADGSFLKNTNDFEFYQAGKAKVEHKNKTGSTNNLIDQLKRIQQGNDCDFDMSEFAEMSKSNVIRRIMQTVVSGKGDNISIELDEEANKIFLQRMFRCQGIRCLYVPGESVTYMALNYNRLGIGQSLPQLAKMHIARLAAMDLADAMANLEAATPHTLMTINVNEKSPEPFADIAGARAAFFESNPNVGNILATSSLSIPMIVDALRETSLTVKVNAGDNQHIPVHDISTEGVDKTNFKPVDQNSRQELLNKIANYLHLSKSWLDVSDDQNNFAIEALAEHQMLLNQVVNWQEEIGEFIADFERKHFHVNAVLMKQLIDVIVENKTLWMPDSKVKLEGSDDVVIKTILVDFLNNLTCTLPTPTSIETTNKIKDSLDVVKDLVDKWMDMAGHTGNLEQVAKLLGFGDDPTKDLEQVKNQIRSVFLADAFRRYNLPMPFDDIINEGKAGGLASMVTAITHQRQNIGEFLAGAMIGVSDADAKILKTYSKRIEKALKSLEAAKEATGLEGEVGAEPTGDELDTDVDADANANNDLIDDDAAGNNNEEEEEEENEGTPSATDDVPADNEENVDGIDPTKNDPEHQPFG